MDGFMVLGWIIAYLIIGIFVVSLTCGSGDDVPAWFVLIWPTILTLLLIAFILWIPCRIGEIIHDWWEDRHS